jgi:hypothetical protein
VIYSFIIVVFFIIFVRSINNLQRQEVPSTITTKYFKDQIKAGNVDKIRTSGDQIDVWLKQP